MLTSIIGDLLIVLVCALKLSRQLQSLLSLWDDQHGAQRRIQVGEGLAGLKPQPQYLGGPKLVNKKSLVFKIGLSNKRVNERINATRK